MAGPSEAAEGPLRPGPGVRDWGGGGGLVRAREGVGRKGERGEGKDVQDQQVLPCAIGERVLCF